MAKIRTNISLSMAAIEEARHLNEAERARSRKNDTLSELIERLIHQAFDQAFDTAAPALTRAAREEEQG